MGIENSHEKFKEIKEFSFEDGLVEAVRRIKNLIETQTYVVVAVGGLAFDDGDIGKSYFSSQLAIKLRSEGIPTIVTNHQDSFNEDHILPALKVFQSLCNRGGGVIVFGASAIATQDFKKDEVKGLYAAQDARLREKSQHNLEIKIPKTDLRIALFRPEQRPDKINFETADIFIQNDKATIKYQK